MRVYDLPGSASSRWVILGPLALAISQGDPTRCPSSATDGTIRHAAPGSASPTAAWTNPQNFPLTTGPTATCSVGVILPSPWRQTI
jgi:hypothetical protein